MAANRPGGFAVKLVAPGLYFVVFLFTTILSFGVVLGDPLSWLPGLSAAVSVFPSLIWGVPALLIGATYSLLSLVFLRLERLQRPTVLDHLRRCAFLYAILVLSASVFFASIYSGGGNLGNAFVLVAMLSVCFAISVDALVLGTARLRHRYTNLRGAR